MTRVGGGRKQWNSTRFGCAECHITNGAECISSVVRGSCQGAWVNSPTAGCAVGEHCTTQLSEQKHEFA